MVFLARRSTSRRYTVSLALYLQRSAAEDLCKATGWPRRAKESLGNGPNQCAARKISSIVDNSSFLIAMDARLLFALIAAAAPDAAVELHHDSCIGMWAVVHAGGVTSTKQSCCYCCVAFLYILVYLPCNVLTAW